MKKNIIKLVSIFAMLSISGLSYSMIRRVFPRIGARATMMPMAMQLREYIKFKNTNAYGAYYADRNAYVYRSPMTNYIGQMQDWFDLYRQYRIEYDACSSTDDHQLSFVLIASLDEKYQSLYEKDFDGSISFGIEAFHQNDFPKIRDRFDVSTVAYTEAYESYKRTPKSFLAYHYLVLHINDLLNLISGKRNISEYVFQYKAKKESEKGQRRCNLQSVTFNDGEKRAVAYYDGQEECINFEERFFDNCLSQQAFTLLHEIEHSFQEKFFVSVSKTFEDMIESTQREKEADNAAASQLPCEICLKINQLQRYLFPVDFQLGYMQDFDFDSHIEHCKNKRCKAHSCNTTELEQKIIFAKKTNSQGLFNEVKTLDNAMGTLYDRLPSV